MEEITWTEVNNILVANMLEFADSGKMARRGLSSFETPHELTFYYNTAELPYIIYQEKGFKHYRSGKFIDKNKGFISVRANGKIERLIYTKMLGIEYNNLEDNQTFIERNHLMMEQIGVISDV